MIWSLQHFVYTIIWIFAQWLPFQSLQTKLQQTAWHHWENQTQFKKPDDQDTNKNHVNTLAIPTVDVQLHKDNLSQYLQQTYGNNWRKRPLLLQGLWAQHELEYTCTRHLMDMTRIVRVLLLLLLLTTEYHANFLYRVC